MKNKASMIIMSHLSDAQELIGMTDDKKFARTISNEINFAKFVLLASKGDLNQEIDANELYKEFSVKFLKK